MNRWGASVQSAELRGRRSDEEEDELGGLSDFEEDEEFDDDDADDEDAEGEDADDEDGPDYDDFDEDFDDDGEPRRGGGGRPRREWE